MAQIVMRNSRYNNYMTCKGLDDVLSYSIKLFTVLKSNVLQTMST